MKEKGDQCILVGYSTQSKGYRVYNKRTRMLVESIHIRFNEIKEVSKTSVVNNTSGLVPQQQKALDYDNPDPVPQRQDVSSSADRDIPSTSAPSTHTNVHADENNNDQAEEGEQLQDDEFTNPFCTPAQDVDESSSHNIGNSNVPTFNQPQVSKYRWTKDHPLEQVRGNPSRPVQTRRQLATDPEMCMYALTVSTAEPKNIKEAMANSAWIEAMQEELHQFDRLHVWELVDKPFGKSIIRLKWLWKNKKDEDQTVICNKARLVAKGYAQEEDYGFIYNKIPLYCDSQSAIAISCNPVQHSRTKHIHTRYHFIKEQVENGIIELYFVITEFQLEDMFTKALPEDRFKYLVRRIGMRCLTLAELEVLAKESA
nr:hypothetical protein [Tanacetum cinerariifolium]